MSKLLRFKLNNYPFIVTKLIDCIIPANLVKF